MDAAFFIKTMFTGGLLFLAAIPLGLIKEPKYLLGKAIHTQIGNALAILAIFIVWASLVALVWSDYQ